MDPELKKMLKSKIRGMRNSRNSPISNVIQQQVDKIPGVNSEDIMDELKSVKRGKAKKHAKKMLSSLKTPQVDSMLNMVKENLPNSNNSIAQFVRTHAKTTDLKTSKVSEAFQVNLQTVYKPNQKSKQNRKAFGPLCISLPSLHNLSQISLSVPCAENRHFYKLMNQTTTLDALFQNIPINMYDRWDNVSNFSGEYYDKQLSSNVLFAAQSNSTFCKITKVVGITAQNVYVWRKPSSVPEVSKTQTVVAKDFLYYFCDPSRNKAPSTQQYNKVLQWLDHIANGRNTYTLESLMRILFRLGITIRASGTPEQRIFDLRICSNTIHTLTSDIVAVALIQFATVFVNTME